MCQTDLFKCDLSKLENYLHNTRGKYAIHLHMYMIIFLLTLEVFYCKLANPSKSFMQELLLI